MYADRFTRAGPVKIKSQRSFPIAMVSVSPEVQPSVPFHYLLVFAQGRTDFGSFVYPASKSTNRALPPALLPSRSASKITS